MFETITHAPAEYFYRVVSGLSRRTFYNRLISKQVEFIQVFRGTKLYSIKDWNIKNPDYELDLMDILPTLEEV